MPPRRSESRESQQQKQKLAIKKKHAHTCVSSKQPQRQTTAKTRSRGQQQRRQHQKGRHACIGVRSLARCDFIRSTSIDHDCGLAWLVDAPPAFVFSSSALSWLQKSSSMSSSSQSSFAREKKTQGKWGWGKREEKPCQRTTRHLGRAESSSCHQKKREGKGRERIAGWCSGKNEPTKAFSTRARN